MARGNPNRATALTASEARAAYGPPVNSTNFISQQAKNSGSEVDMVKEALNSYDRAANQLRSYFDTQARATAALAEVDEKNIRGRQDKYLSQGVDKVAKWLDRDIPRGDAKPAAEPFRIDEDADLSKETSVPMAEEDWNLAHDIARAMNVAYKEIVSEYNPRLMGGDINQQKPIAREMGNLQVAADLWSIGMTAYSNMVGFASGSSPLRNSKVREEVGSYGSNNANAAMAIGKLVGKITELAKDHIGTVAHQVRKDLKDEWKM